jgi:hypothetical protein
MAEMRRPRDILGCKPFKSSLASSVAEETTETRRRSRGRGDLPQNVFPRDGHQVCISSARDCATPRHAHRAIGPRPSSDPRPNLFVGGASSKVLIPGRSWGFGCSSPSIGNSASASLPNPFLQDIVGVSSGGGLRHPTGWPTPSPRTANRCKVDTGDESADRLKPILGEL